MTDPNQNPEQKARDTIDAMLNGAGWEVQDKDRINLTASLGVAVREYQTDVGYADYVLFVGKKPIGVIEAKQEDLGFKLLTVEEQAEGYANSKLKYIDNDPLPFVYESTGVLTRFTDMRDPKPRSRRVFSFHQPETLQELIKESEPLRQRLFSIPELDPEGLRDCQINAITNLEVSFRDNRPRALIQMATGSGKTFTAITAIYRLLKFANAKRVLFLVDTKNLGEQAEQEFMAYTPNDDNRKFTELYNVQRLKSSYVSTDNQVCISTIQRMYSILKGEDLDEAAEEENPNERVQPKNSMPVVYSSKIPLEFFDFIIIDECHRSIYNLWRQVLDYFDAFLIGLTATPDARTYGFFNENVVSEYTHEQAVLDGVNVGYDVFTIETEITKNGSRLVAKEYVDKRDKLTRQKRWEQLDEDVAYTRNQLDKEVVNPSQIRNIIRAFKDSLPVTFPNRKEIPKALIFAKTDSHADDIIKIVREEFGEGNAFCKKVTYQAKEDPKSVLAQFRNDYNPRIAVTVDMIATGTDVKPLECLLFMRNVKSRNYFEQMKGRGTRVINNDDLQKVTSSAQAKTHFIIIDAVGVTKSLKTDSRPLERKRSVSIKDLMMGVMMGAQSEDMFTSLASRLTRLERQIDSQEQEKLTSITGGYSASDIAKALLNAFDPDVIDSTARQGQNIPPDCEPTEEQQSQAQQTLIDHASSMLTGEIIEYLDTVRRDHEQIIDTVNLDTVNFAGWDTQATEQAQNLVNEFKEYIETHKDQITALKIFYNLPCNYDSISYHMIEELLDAIKANKPHLLPLRIWQAYQQIDQAQSTNPLNELTALVALIRRVVGLDSTLTTYETTVNRNFKDWVFNKQAGALKFTEEQMAWLRMIKDHIASSFHLERDDLDYAPFDSHGGIGKLYKLFGEDMDVLLSEINEVLAA